MLKLFIDIISFIFWALEQALEIKLLTVAITMTYVQHPLEKNIFWAGIWD